ncbi:MAG: ATP-binding protein [Candidatus Methylomirabilis sp.]
MLKKLTSEKIIRRIGMAVVALILAGILGFLYSKTQAVDFRRQNELIGYLREIKDLDSKWNEEVLRSRQALAPEAKAPANANAVLRKELLLTAQGLDLKSPGLKQGIAELKQAFRQKAELFEQFRAESTALKKAVREVRGQAAAARATGGPVAAEVDALAAKLLEYYADSSEAGAKDLLDRSERLRGRAAGASEPLERLAEAVRSVVGQRPAEEALAVKLSFLTTSERVDALARGIDQEFQSALQDKDLYGIYLVYYSGALLLVLGFLGARLRQSYGAIQQLNLALKEVNEGLESKVAERTAELSKALEQLKESETLLIQTEKMSALGQMVAGIAHEINTPLAYVKSGLESMANRLPQVGHLVEEFRKLLDMLHSSNVAEDQLAAQFAQVSDLTAQFKSQQTAEDLPGLVKDGLYGISQISEIIINLKNFSRLDRSKVSQFNLNEGLESTLLIARNIVKHKTVKKAFGKIPPISCSPSQINQVFLNLITNAAQAIPDEGGIIFLRTAVKDGRHVAVEVADNGHGIPESVLPKIFDPFFTTKEVGKGTGLGLSIAYKIIQQHGGTMSVTSKEGAGTKFTIMLPVTAPEAAQLVA